MTLTNARVWQIAREQSAIDSGCRAEDFCGDAPCIVQSRADARARRYLQLPFLCDFTSYGGNVVASVAPELRSLAAEYLARYDSVHCFETPNLHWLMRRLQPYNANVCFMAEYYLPDVDRWRQLPCRYETRVLAQAEFRELYLPQWSNALCADRPQLDMLGVGAYDGGRLIGLVGASADCDAMWQIGVDVLPGWRRQGVASALTSRLAGEILARGKVPFYCRAWSNVASGRNAIRSGFLPAWVQLTVRPEAVIDRFNRRPAEQEE